jgi:hypothetical protein
MAAQFPTGTAAQVGMMAAAAANQQGAMGVQQSFIPGAAGMGSREQRLRFAAEMREKHANKGPRSLNSWMAFRSKYSQA